MAKHLRRDLEHLERELLELGSLVEHAIKSAIIALIDRRPELADEVIKGDDAIDAKEVEVEEECLKVLALHQPCAGDLRTIVAMLKVNNDLERMGDCATNIAERARDLADQEPIPTPLDELRRMTEAVRAMVGQSLDALVRHDAGRAREVCLRDAEVDGLNRRMFVLMQELMQKEPKTVPRAVSTLSVSRNLERIADLATNIAEDVVFLVDGEVIRHRRAVSARRESGRKRAVSK
jgi:phosphate transport system protein